MKEKSWWNIVFGQPLEVLRSVWEATPGGIAIAAGPGVELHGATLTSAHEKTLCGVGRFVGALVALVIEWCMSSHCVGFLVFSNSCLSGLGAVPIMVLADLNVIPHLSLATIDVGVGGQTAQRWLHKRLPWSLQRHVWCTRDLGAESMQCLQIVLPSTHFVMSVWREPPAHLRMFLLLLRFNWQDINKW